MARTLVKICGTTSPEDAQIAQNAGADFLGVITLHPASARNVDLSQIAAIQAASPVSWALVTVNQNAEALRQLASEFAPAALQLHGDESPATVRELSKDGFKIWKAIHGDAKTLLEQAKIYHCAGASAILVDARETSPAGTIYGGTGQVADWSGARELVESGFCVILAGGLNPQNVARAIETVRPWMVDVLSGVEAQKGVKDPEKVRDFLSAARSARNK